MTKILIVKLSSLGDVVHTMPTVQDILTVQRHAQIDWVVESHFAPLVRRCAGINRVIEINLRRWRKNLWSAQTRVEWAEFKAELQRDEYDAVLDLQGLTKSAMVSWMARLTVHGRRYAMANGTDDSSYERATRWVAHKAIQLPTDIHAVQRARWMSAKALGYAMPGELAFGLAGQPGPLQEDLEVGVHIVPPTTRPCVALIHGSSRPDKLWPLANWLDLGERLNRQGYALALPHGNAAEQREAEVVATQLEHAIVWPRLDLDAMVDALNTCVGVIGVDSGLSHLAVALDLLNVQIYNFNTAWRTGPPMVGHQVSVVGRPCPSVDAVWAAWLRVTGVIDDGMPLMPGRRAFARKPA